MVKEAKDSGYAYRKRDDSLRDYKLGRKDSGSKINKGPYTGIPRYIQEVRDSIEHGNADKRYIMRDLGVADRLISQGIRGSGQEFRDAVRLYNLSMVEADQLGDAALARRIYDRAMTKLRRAKSTLSYGVNGVGRSGFNGRAKKSMLETSLGDLENPSNLKMRGAALAGSAAVIVGLFGFIIVFGSMTGAVVGGKSSTVFGIGAIILSALLIGILIKKFKPKFKY